MKRCTKMQSQASTGRCYLETDIDRVRKLDELVANGSLMKEMNEKHQEKALERARDREDRMPWERNGVLAVEKTKEADQSRERLWEKETVTERGKEKKVIRNSYEPKWASTGRNNLCPAFKWPDGFPRMSYRSISLPRAVNIMDCDGETQRDMSSFHDHKEDLRKRLSYATHKLEMVESEFDSTRQYLETELRRAQEELEKFTEKLRRIQSSYAALQRINQDLEDKMHRTSQHHEEEKRSLSREIIVLNNHLMEAKLTINKLKKDNDLYRKDCNLAAQLLQCSKSHHRAHKMSELPLDFQERISSHIKKHNQGSEANMAMCHSNYSDAIPTAIIAKVLEKPEPGNNSPATRSPSPHTQERDSIMGTASNDHFNRRVAYKTSDLYCSDTALYCPERWQDTDRRQSIDLHGTTLLQLHAQNSIDSNADEEAYHSGSFSHHEPPSSFRHHEEFSAGSLPASSSYSSFSLASDDKGGMMTSGLRTASSTLSTSHQGLYMDWRDSCSGDYERKSVSSYDKDGSGFSKSKSIQHIGAGRSPQKGTSPAYTRTASCFSEPYQASTPRLASSRSMGSPTGLGQAQSTPRESRAEIHAHEDDLSSQWKQLSVEDVNNFSSSYRNVTGRVSPYSFSECHYAVGPSSKAKGSLYSSFQEGDDVFHSHMLDQCFALGSLSPSRSPKLPPAELRKPKKNSATYRAKDGNPDGSLPSGRSKEKERAKKDYMNLSAGSSAESLHQSSLEASSLQHYPSPRPSVRPRPSSSSALSAVGPALPKKTSPRYQKFGSTGLTRKDSLTKAQLYGTLLN
ncbi:brain-enriched guanylate kinase-associated protein isoform X1 [Stigmatopora argus]